MRPALLAVLVLAACAPRTESLFQPQPGAPATNPAVAEACRQEVGRILARQDRSQLIREDERDARLGADATPFTFRTRTDQLGRAYQFERMQEQCIRENTRATAPRPAPRAGA